MGWRMAIDFGTSNTTAAVWLDGAPAPAVVRLDDNSDQMPSAVLVTDSDQIWVGRAATRQAAVQPDRFLANPKSYLGESAWQFGDRSVPVPLLVAAVLERAVRRAREYAGGERPDHVVLTHPEQWKGHRTAQLREAARLAGLGSVTLVPEPVAAATLYAHGSGGPALVAVGDLGAGTCDVAVLERDASGSYRVLASDGEPVGGDHLDAALVALVLGELDSSGHDETAQGLRLERRSVAGQRAAGRLLALRQDVREAKHHLAEYPHASLHVGSATVTITDRQLEDTAEPVVTRFVALTRRVFAEAGVEKGDLGAFYLTGGSSRLRAVPAKITPELGRPPLLKLDPKTVTVLGALHWLLAEQASPTPPSPQPSPNRPPESAQPVRSPVPDYLFRPAGYTGRSGSSAGSAPSAASAPTVQSAPSPDAADVSAANPSGRPSPGSGVGSEPADPPAAGRRVDDDPTSFLSATFGSEVGEGSSASPPHSAQAHSAQAHLAQGAHSAQAPSAAGRHSGRRVPRLVPIVTAILVVVAAAVGLWWWNSGARTPAGLATPTTPTTTPPSSATGTPASPSAPAWPHQTSFRTQSRNIVCTFRARAQDRSDAEVLCTAISNDWQKSTPPAGCPAERWDHTLRLGTGGRAEMTCTEATPPDAPLSTYGDREAFGPLTCDVSARGVTCRHGKRTFFIARETWTIS